METWILNPLYQTYYEAKSNDTDPKSKNMQTNPKSA